MIRLTGIGTHETIYISPESITSICGYDNGCSQIYSGSDLSVVTESPAEVARKVLEWRLAMDRYRAYANAAALDEKPQSNECWELAANAKAELVRLAGHPKPHYWR